MQDPNVALASTLIYGFFTVLISILLLLLGRVIVLWYFKINQAITLLQSIDSHLAKLNNTPPPPQSQSVDKRIYPASFNEPLKR